MIMMILMTATHKTTGAIDYFGGLKEEVCKEIQELIVIVKMLCEEDLADDVGRSFVKQQVRGHWFACEIKGTITLRGKLSKRLLVPLKLETPKLTRN